MIHENILIPPLTSTGFSHLVSHRHIPRTLGGCKSLIRSTFRTQGFRRLTVFLVSRQRNISWSGWRPKGYIYVNPRSPTLTSLPNTIALTIMEPRTWREAAGTHWLVGARAPTSKCARERTRIPYVVRSGICRIGGTYLIHIYSVRRFVGSLILHATGTSDPRVPWTPNIGAALPISEVCLPIVFSHMFPYLLALVSLLPWRRMPGTGCYLLPWPSPLCSNRARVYVPAIWVLSGAGLGITNIAGMAPPHVS